MHLVDEPFKQRKHILLQDSSLFLNKKATLFRFPVPLSICWLLLLANWVYSGKVITSEIEGSEVLLVLIVNLLSLSLSALLTFVLKGRVGETEPCG